MKRIVQSLILFLTLFAINCSNSDDSADNVDIALALMNARNMSEISRLNGVLLGDFELKNVTYTAVGGTITETFTDNKLDVVWNNVSFPLFGSKYLNGYYYSIIVSYDNNDNSFYALRGRVNYEFAGCECTDATCSNATYSLATGANMVDGQSCTSGAYPGTSTAITDPYRGNLKQYWDKAEYYRYRYTDTQSDGNFYLCVEAGPYATLAEAQADTFKANFVDVATATSITYTSYSDYQNGVNNNGCPDRGDLSGVITDSAWTAGVSYVPDSVSGFRKNLFDGGWFQLTKVE